MLTSAGQLAFRLGSTDSVIGNIERYRFVIRDVDGENGNADTYI
jgi:hypothetical protein